MEFDEIGRAYLIIAAYDDLKRSIFQLLSGLSNESSWPTEHDLHFLLWPRTDGTSRLGEATGILHVGCEGLSGADIGFLTLGCCFVTGEALPWRELHNASGLDNP